MRKELHSITEAKSLVGISCVTGFVTGYYIPADAGLVFI